MIADAKRLPFRPGAFDHVHAVNPYMFNPVSAETTRVMAPHATLSVTGNAANPYFKNSPTGKHYQQPESQGLKQTGEGPMTPAHVFGEQGHSDGSPLDVSTSRTKRYRRRVTDMELARKDYEQAQGLPDYADMSFEEFLKDYEQDL